ncbi:MAG: GntR family transcriptional regulator [Epulopiscium sp. Nele67-Bin002]|nr:MAG: GntR family transcriptional regulator [Epulopiscium sp. Nuni2H_MBin001]OON90809.1 MAG: GntR family transcriptional regulator [Epulopiscium sp. Nele67-Bin001]OON91783.1 MAG: GntR family transcriptional regulator [Epulopiscium sp. Nele67-Bin002]
MTWQFDNDKPIYIQLINILKLKIISGEIGVGEKLSSVRELAQMAGVNPNTMQRALAELEREGLVHSNRTAGRFVTEDKNLIVDVRNVYARTYISQLVQNLIPLGFSKKELMEFIQQELLEGENNVSAV